MQFSHRAFGTPQSQANIMSGERKKKCKHGTKSSDHATCSFLIQTLTKQKDTRYNKKKEREQQQVESVCLCEGHHDTITPI